MAQYFLNADDYTLGDSYAETPWNLTDAGFTLEVVSDNGRNAFRFTNTINDWTTVDLNHGLDLTGTCEVKMFVRSGDPGTDDTHFVMWATGSGSGTSGIAANLINSSTNRYRLTEFPFSLITSAVFTGVESPHNLSFETDGSSSHKIFAWDDGASKPGTPLIDSSEPVSLTANDNFTVLSAVDDQIIYIYEIGIGTNGDAAPTAPVGGTDALTADDLQSTSSVTSPAIGQTHAILADDNSSNSTVSQPALGQEHSLLSDGLESASTVTSPALSESNALLADDLESASSVSSPAVGQEHSLLSDGLQSTSSVTQPAIGQSHGLAADDLSSNSTVSSPALAEVSEGDLLADDLESASTVSSPAIGQQHALPSDSLSSNSTVSSPTLTEGVGLNANNLESASTVSSPAVGQIHVLAANDDESASTVSSPQVGQVHVLNADSLGSSSTVTQPSLANPELQFARPVVNPAISINNTVYGILIDNTETSVAVNQ